MYRVIATTSGSLAIRAKRPCSQGCGRDKLCPVEVVGLRTAQDVMRRGAPTIRPDTPYKSIVATMDAFRTSALPVVGDGRRYAGMVTEDDVLLKEIYGPLPTTAGTDGWRNRIERAKAGGVVAGQLMSSAPTVTPGMRLWEIATLMHDHSLLRLPVVDLDGVLLGIVSWRDLLGVFLRTDEAIRRDIVAELLKRLAVSEPHPVQVEVLDGVVTLHGEVETRQAIAALKHLASAIEGVVKVDTQLTVRDETDARAMTEAELAATRPDR